MIKLLIPLIAATTINSTIPQEKPELRDSISTTTQSVSGIAKDAHGSVVIQGDIDPKKIKELEKAYAKRYKAEHKKPGWTTNHPKAWRVFRTRVVPATNFVASVGSLIIQIVRL